jgi:hypothetical protein
VKTGAHLNWGFTRRGRRVDARLLVLVLRIDRPCRARWGVSGDSEPTVSSSRTTSLGSLFLSWSRGDIVLVAFVLLRLLLLLSVPGRCVYFDDIPFMKNWARYSPAAMGRWAPIVHTRSQLPAMRLLRLLLPLLLLLLLLLVRSRQGGNLRRHDAGVCALTTSPS